MKASSDRVFTDDVVGAVTIKKSIRSRRVTIRVNSCGDVSVSIPFLCPYSSAEKFIMLRRAWILKVREKQKSRIGGEGPMQEDELKELRKKAKELLPTRLAELAQKNGFEYHSVRIKNNSSNWGSCSSKGNINLNLHLVRVPEDLRDYVMLHELCHLRYMNHGAEFHALLESICPNHLEKRHELRKYRIF